MPKSFAIRFNRVPGSRLCTSPVFVFARAGVPTRPATPDDSGAHFLGSCASAAGFEG